MLLQHITSLCDTLHPSRCKSVGYRCRIACNIGAAEQSIPRGCQRLKAHLPQLPFPPLDLPCPPPIPCHTSLAKPWPPLHLSCPDTTGRTSMPCSYNRLDWVVGGAVVQQSHLTCNANICLSFLHSFSASKGSQRATLTTLDSYSTSPVFCYSRLVGNLLSSLLCSALYPPHHRHKDVELPTLYHTRLPGL
jgi:hypothetical protein